MSRTSKVAARWPWLVFVFDTTLTVVWPPTAVNSTTRALQRRTSSAPMFQPSFSQIKISLSVGSRKTSKTTNHRSFSTLRRQDIDFTHCAMLIYILTVRFTGLPPQKSDPTMQSPKKDHFGHTESAMSSCVALLHLPHSASMLRS